MTPIALLLSFAAAVLSGIAIGVIIGVGSTKPSGDSIEDGAYRVEELNS